MHRIQTEGRTSGHDDARGAWGATQRAEEVAGQVEHILGVDSRRGKHRKQGRGTENRAVVREEVTRDGDSRLAMWRLFRGVWHRSLARDSSPLAWQA
jgi:hypothetical protein